ncbi:MAG: thermosome subunit [Candidatus Hadarchaeum yellowstonense]|uniref:Thermosome subunit n=1 Tax=Hadarchaeum yellowstonense TaxID=1776334 RepID=A0A147JTJ6_HADYE|nr:MAG: thermosome subunit [Candidatus Hadarchaeum yellowstonense]
MSQLGGQPILILPEKVQRYLGRDAQRMNIMAARVIAESVRTTLGPRGMDKMLVDNLGDITITNDGVTILEEMDVEHPAAKMMVEVSKAQEDEVGDGTTTAVVLAGELLKKSEELLEQDIHPTVIISGYRLAAEEAQRILEKMATPVTKDDEKILKQIAKTSMSSKGSEIHGDKLAELCVRAVKQIVEEADGKIEADIDNIKVEKKTGGSSADTQLIKGIVLDKEVVHPGMPKRVENAKIALLNLALEVKKTETDAKINITDPEQLKRFLDEEQRMLKEMVDQIKSVGANVVFCQKGIDDVAQHYLAKAGILAARRVKESDMEKLARATGGNCVTNIKDLSPKDLGTAELVEERKIAGDEMIFVEGCKDPRAVSILVRGGTEHVVDEVERAVHDAISVVSAAIEDGKIVAGGGAPEIEVAKGLRDYSESVGGREALAVNAFADAIEVIPRTLAENAGLDPIDILVQLRSAHEKNGGKNIGIDVISGKVLNTLEQGIVEPLRVKVQAIKSATEVTEMILRIDDVIAAGKLEKEEKEKEKGAGPGSEMGGMPEM